MKSSQFLSKYFFGSIILFGIFFNDGVCFAKKVPGYLIDNNLDTIKGKVKIFAYDQNSKGFVINGINLEPFYSSVKFKADNSRKFKTYFPEDVIKFGFQYNSDEFIFEAFKIEINSIVKSERFNYRFLSLVYKGELALYKNIIRVTNPLYDNNLNDKSIVYYDYYLYDAQIGLSKVELSIENGTLVELLAKYNIEQEFLETIPNKTNLKEIKNILIEYDLWRLQQYTAE